MSGQTPWRHSYASGWAAKHEEREPEDPGSPQFGRLMDAQNWRASTSMVPFPPSGHAVSADPRYYWPAPGPQISLGLPNQYPTGHLPNQPPNVVTANFTEQAFYAEGTSARADNRRQVAHNQLGFQHSIAQRSSIASHPTEQAVVNHPNMQRASKARRRNPAAFYCTFEGCNDDFTTNRALQNHLQRHNPARAQYSCPEDGCSSVLSSPDNLKRHMQKHEGKSHCCPQCEIPFTRKDSLHKHMKKCSIPPHAGSSDISTDTF